MNDLPVGFKTKAQAAELVKICERSLDYARARGELPFYRVSSRRILFAERDLLDFMERFRVDPCHPRANP